MSTSKNIVSHLEDTFFGGSQKAFCEFVGRAQSTVATWKKANGIPFKDQRAILEKSDMVNLGVTPDDFFPERIHSGLDAGVSA